MGLKLSAIVVKSERKMKNTLIIILAMAISGCKNDDVAEVTHLNGQWVDINTNIDTLTFELIDNNEYFVLGRGKEMRSGHLLPKSGSGLYRYTLLTDDSISLQWAFSSNCNFNNFYFQQLGDQILIEKFFDAANPGIMLTFEKID